MEKKAVDNEVADCCFQEKVASLCVLTDKAMIMIRRIREARAAPSISPPRALLRPCPPFVLT